MQSYEALQIVAKPPTRRRPKPAHKKTALDVIAEEEARQAIKEEEKEIAIAKASINPLDNINWNAPEFQGFVGFFRKIKVYAEEKKKQMEKNAFKYGPPYNEDYGGSILEEVNKPQASTLDVHQMLLEGADPRVSLVHDGKKHGQQEEEEGHTGRERFRRRGGRGDLWCVCACSGRGFLDLNKNDIQVLKVRSGNRLAQSLDRRVGHGASARNLGCVGVQYERGRLFWQVQCQWRS